MTSIIVNSKIPDPPVFIEFSSQPTSEIQKEGGGTEDISEDFENQESSRGLKTKAFKA